MTKIFRENTQWAIAGNVSTTALEELAGQLPQELQGDGSNVVAGTQGFAALLVFGDVPNEALAKRLLSSATPIYLLDFDDEAPVIVRFDRKKTRTDETRVDEHPAEFLEERGIAAPGYTLTPSPVVAVGLVEGTTLEEAQRAVPDAEVEFRKHPRGVLVVDDQWGMVPCVLSKSLRRRAYMVLRNPEDGWFSCILYEPGKKPASFSPVRPDPNAPPLDNILGETTLEGILCVLAIPGELLGLHASESAVHGR
jgi:hypothetical protein